MNEQKQAVEQAIEAQNTQANTQAQRPMLPSDTFLALANEIQGLKQAQECLQEIVDFLGLVPNEQGAISFKSIVEAVKSLKEGV